MTEGSDPPKATKTELERRRQLEARPGHGKSMLSMTKLLQLLPAAALFGTFDQRELENVQALAELASVLGCSIRELEQAAAERSYALTTERIRLWTESAKRGELGINEILIAMEPPPVGLRGKGAYGIVDESTGWEHDDTVVFRREPFGKSEQLQRERPEPRKRKSTFAQRARRWR